MARPRKRRHVCGLPERNHFGPLDLPAREQELVQMTVDEYETIRLIDFEDFTQEECAQQMNVARTTVQAIYSQARKTSPGLSGRQDASYRRWGLPTM